LIFIRDTVTSKPTIVLIIGHFLTFAKFRRNINIPLKRANSTAAWNSATRGILWALIITLGMRRRMNVHFL